MLWQPSTDVHNIGVLKIFAKFTGKQLCQIFLNKKRLQHRCFPLNFAKFKNSFFTEHLPTTILNF